jgi:SAM-dependent methyltransferase
MPSDSRELQRKFYDDTADEYRENFQQVNPYFRFVVDHFLAAVAPRAGERVLELGSSGGRFTLPLLEAGCRVTGVDISPRSIAYLERLVADHPLRGNLTLLDDDAGTLTKITARDFDAVVGAHILHHLDDIRAALAAAWSRLRPGGRAVFVEPNPWNLQWYVHVTIHPRRRWRVERGFLRMWPQRVRRAFLGAGFAGCRVSTFGCFPPFVLNAIPASRAWEAALERTGPLARTFTLNVFSAWKA